MSFIRFGEQNSDVYVYPGSYTDGREYYECCGCSLTELARFDNKPEMNAHLVEHQNAGQHVPVRAFVELENWDFDIAAELGEWADAGRGKEFATYEEAWKAAAQELAEHKARIFAHADKVAEDLTVIFADVLPPGMHFAYDVGPTDGNG